MSDRPDYTLPVSIEAITIASLPIDIVAQTVGNLTIDIAAQSVGNINVNLAASSATVNVNIASSAATLNVNLTASDITLNVDVTKGVLATRNDPFIINGGFERYTGTYPGYAQFEGWTSAWVYALSPGHTGVVSCYLRWGTVSYIEQVLDVVAEVSYIAEFSFFANGSINDVVQAIVTYTDGTTTTHNFTLTSTDWEYCDIKPNLSAGKSVRSLKITTPAATYDFVDDVILTVYPPIGDILVDINIKTSSGVNLVIDKLTQTAYVEDRRTLSNNGATASWGASTGAYRGGKFFPRGMRGFLDVIEVYCRDAGSAGGTITVYLSPQPSMGAITSATITVPAAAAAAWRTATFRRFWNYDSLFIWVLSSTTDIQNGYDTETPYDGHNSADSGVNWIPQLARPWFRTVMTAQTVGDLPVSGTINTVALPNSSSARQAVILNVPATSELYDTLQAGAGETLIVIFTAPSTSARDYLKPRLRCDGVQVLPFDWTFAGWQDDCILTSTPGITIGEWDAVDNVYVIIVTIRFPFKQSLEIGYYNTDSAAHLCTVAYSYSKIT